MADSKYKVEKRLEKNKIKKIMAHLKFHINDIKSKARIDELRKVLGK